MVAIDKAHVSMLGIYDCFGYGTGYNVPFDERYKLIKQAGFDCVMLWWSDAFGRGPEYRRDAKLAREAGLYVENIHAPVLEQNNLSLNNLDGDQVYQNYLQCVKDCFDYKIPKIVIHLPDDSCPINKIGLERLEHIIDLAEKINVKIAFENLNNIHNLQLVLSIFQSPNVGFCYDSCHHINFLSDIDLLSLYGNRLFALHLHDNGGIHNQHQLPFDGKLNWDKIMNKITLAGYKGATTLEPMNWDYKHLSIQQFLALAYQRCVKINSMR